MAAIAARGSVAPGTHHRLMHDISTCCTGQEVHFRRSPGVSRLPILAVCRRLCTLCSKMTPFRAVIPSASATFRNPCKACNWHGRASPSTQFSKSRDPEAISFPGFLAIRPGGKQHQKGAHSSATFSSTASMALSVAAAASATSLLCSIAVSQRQGWGHLGSFSSTGLIPLPRRLTSDCRRSSQLHVVRNVTTVKSSVATKPAGAIRKIQRMLESRERSAVEITEEYLSRVGALEPSLHSFLHVASDDEMLTQAAALDRHLAEGKELAALGPLAGVPTGVKDNICTKGMPTTAGSKILEGYRPPYDASVVKRIKDAGALVVGKTNLDEFGMGSSTENSAYFRTANPWDLSRVPGGSSGGSAAAVAANQCVAALGSDTGGSIRLPASFCGLVGLKPTYGRVSRLGLIGYASSLDTIGVLAQSVEDAAIMMGVISGQDICDSTSSHSEVPDYTAGLEPLDSFSSKPLKGVRLGIIKETIGEGDGLEEGVIRGGVDSGVINAIKDAGRHLEELGATLDEVSLPTFALGLPAYYVLATSEASSNLARYDGVRYGLREGGEDNGLAGMYKETRRRGLGPEVKRRILMGTYALSAGYYDAYYKKAQQVRTLVQQDLVRALSIFDALLLPTAPTAAFRLGEKITEPLSMYVGDMMTVNVNLAGLPALVVPCGTVPGGPKGLPVGLQLIGRAFGEGQLLRYGHIFEQTAPVRLGPLPELIPA
ncbi:hypothetical protein CBR_g12438 [Chara braunii]|uniref:Glutamyl-tRNA(Gln) amidotransferase subunit A, chloroplastic/mitochondrial n=1 Tax=Chara braunii TaxID=69332 RepID=A0A388JSJ9_CHABU|nr:hypothetical protein CBR_g12438 [Chara braunii]|eukprot:GBG60702.1 hypothetical protein CBR_g12438 [Chara braunii]